MTATDRTLAPNKDSHFTITKIPNSNGAKITISDVKSTDAGTYWCGIEYPSSAMYRQLRIIVSGPPDPHDVRLNMLSDDKTVSPTPEIDYHHDDLNIADHKDDTGQALRQCSDNSACALALLHKKELKILGDCWVCHALAARWQAKPLTANIVLQGHTKESWGKEDHGKCTVPLGMMMLLIAGQQIRDHVSVVPHPNVTCIDSHSTLSNTAFEVPL